MTRSSEVPPKTLRRSKPWQTYARTHWPTGTLQPSDNLNNTSRSSGNLLCSQLSENLPKAVPQSEERKRRSHGEKQNSSAAQQSNCTSVCWGARDVSEQQVPRVRHPVMQQLPRAGGHASSWPYLLPSRSMQKVTLRRAATAPREQGPPFLEPCKGQQRTTALVSWRLLRQVSEWGENNQKADKASWLGYI